MTKNRPQSIIWFERLFLASIAVTFVDMFVHPDTFFGTDEMADDAGLIFALLMVVATLIWLGIEILLWFFIVHRASNLAKWINVILLVLSLGLTMSSISEYSSSENFFTAVTHSLLTGATLYLFRPDAALWFRSKGLISDGEGDELSDISR